MPHPNVVADRTSAGYLRLLLSRPEADLGFVVAFVVSAVLYAVLQRKPATSIPADDERETTGQITG